MGHMQMANGHRLQAEEHFSSQCNYMVNFVFSHFLPDETAITGRVQTLLSLREIYGLCLFAELSTPRLRPCLNVNSCRRQTSRVLTNVK